MTVPVPANLSFEENIDPEVVRYTHLENGKTWKGLQTLEEYSQREKLLGESSIATKGQSSEMKEKFPVGHELFGLKYFVLKDMNLEESSKTSQIVSSCEALCRLGYAIYPESNGKIVPVLTVCIGGVYTPHDHRGKGYARTMIGELNKHFDKLSKAPDAPEFVRYTVLTLYSEVGEYYSKSWYYSLHVPLHIVKDLDEFFDRFWGQEVLEEGRSLGFDDYKDLVALQQKKFDSQLMALHKQYPEKFVFTVASDIDIYKWFEIRDIFLMEKTNRHQNNLKFGFALKDDNHIIWHHHWNADALVIVKVFVKEEMDRQHYSSTLKKLIAQALSEAKKCGLKNLIFWDEEIPIKKLPELYSILTKMEDGSKVFAENGSLSAVRPPNGFSMEDTIWDNNTKFCWF